MIRNAILLWAFITLTATPQLLAQSALLASDSFTTGTGSLNGSSGGAGWASAWTTQNGSATAPGYNLATTQPLAYLGLQATDGHAVGGDVYQSSGRTLDTSTTGPFGGLLKSGLIGASGKTLWFSVLLRKDANSEDENSITLHPGTTAWFANSPLVAIGYFGGSSNQGATRYWSVKAAGSVMRTAAPVVVGQAALLVLRIEFASSTTVALYVNPASLGGAAPAASNAQTVVPAASSSGFRSLAYYGGNGANQSSLDEIRVGTSYAAVTPAVSAPLAYESFTGPAGALNAVATGAGWSGAWTTQNSSLAVPGYNLATANPLTYGSPAPPGNYAVGGDSYQSTGRGLDVSPTGAFASYLNNGLIGAPGKTLWFSALMRKDAATNDENSLNLHAGSPPWYVSNQLVGVGYFGSASNSAGVSYWSLKVAGLVYQTQAPVVPGQTALLVLRLDFGATSTAALYVNPPGMNAPASPSTAATTSVSIGFQSVAYYGGDGANQSSIDELRFGSSFASVSAGTGSGGPPPPQLPSSPSGLAASAGNATVLLSWSAAANVTYNVKRSITPGSGYAVLASGLKQAVYTDASAANGVRFYYVVTAVNSNGESPNAAEVTAMPQSSTPGATPLGINVEFPSDYAVGQPFADLMKSGRTPGLPGQSLSTNAPLDAQGWPTSDFEVFLADTKPNLGGTYKLSFVGQASVSIQLTAGVVANQIYNTATNVTTADVTLPGSAFQSVSIRFQNTYRTAGAANSGLTLVQLMRPGYAVTDTFTIPFKALIGRFQAIRFMEWTSTNSQQAGNWTDRTAPNYAWQAARQFGTAFGSSHSGGIAWEYCIQLANETGKDLWINIPHKATDDYILQLALLLKANLRPGLKVYVEFSNETWNGAYGFSQINELHDMAVAQVNAGGSILNYDSVNDSSGWTYQKRLVGKRIVDTSNIFRSVFGDAAMMARVLPVLESQAACLSCWFQESLSFIDSYYGALNTGNSTPHPVNYFLYGGGGASYYPYLLDGGMLDTLTVDSIFGTWLPENKAAYYVPNVRSYSHWTTAFGLKNVSYEGGWSLDHTGHSAAVKDQAGNNDARGPAVLVDGINTWNALGGDLYMYFRGSGDPVWNLTTDITNLNTLRLQAIDAVNRSPRSALTLGVQVPAELPAVQFNATNTYGSPSQGDLPVNPGGWFSYTIRTNAPATLQLGFAAAGADGTGRLAVFVDGNSLGTVVIPATMQDTAKASVALGAGLHSIRVKCVGGSIAVRAVEVTP